MDDACRTNKAKEKAAESLMSIATTVASATLIGVTVLPLTAFLTAIFGGTVITISSIRAVLDMDGSLTLMIFIPLYLIPLIIAGFIKRDALNLYDEVSRSSKRGTVKK